MCGNVDALVCVQVHKVVFDKKGKLSRIDSKDLEESLVFFFLECYKHWKLLREEDSKLKTLIYFR